MNYKNVYGKLVEHMHITPHVQDDLSIPNESLELADRFSFLILTQGWYNSRFETPGEG